MAKLCIQKNTKIIFVFVRETMMLWINISKRVNWCIKHVYLFHLNFHSFTFLENSRSQSPSLTELLGDTCNGIKMKLIIEK